LSASTSIRELEALRSKLHQSFTAAAKGQSWPEQFVLTVAEQALLMGICGSLLVRVASLSSTNTPHERADELRAIVAWLERQCFTPAIHAVPGLIQSLLDELHRSPDWPQHVHDLQDGWFRCLRAIALGHQVPRS
jgi:hypothetical protein